MLGSASETRIILAFGFFLCLSYFVATSQNTIAKVVAITSLVAREAVNVSTTKVIIVVFNRGTRRRINFFFLFVFAPCQGEGGTVDIYQPLSRDELQGKLDNFSLRFGVINQGLSVLNVTIDVLLGIATVNLSKGVIATDS